MKESRAGHPIPVTAILPCKDNADDLPSHLEGMSSWIDAVERIVVVDSSSDDSVAILRDRLPAQKTEIHQIEPGLYQAWNFGAEKVRSRYCYYATVGDRITFEELAMLSGIAEETDSDVVVAPPRMVDEEGAPCESERWPVHFIAETLRDHGIRHATIPGALLGLLSSALAPKSLIGSSASNLYRSAFLQTHPWPVDFGHGGDTAWLCRHHAKIRLTICAEEAGQFVLHYRHQMKDARDDAALAARMRAECLANAEAPEAQDALDLAPLFSEGGMRAVDAWQRVLWDWAAGQWEAATAAEQQRHYIRVLETEVEKLKRSFLNRLTRSVSGILNRSGPPESKP